MPETTAPGWHTPASAKADFGITVTAAQLRLAKGECLHRFGLISTLAAPPSQEFADGVAHQALANRQSTQAAAPDDGYGNGENRVRLYPFDKKIMAMLIIPESFEITDEIRDRSYVRSLVG